jgi:hypothetical protein
VTGILKTSTKNLPIVGEVTDALKDIAAPIGGGAALGAASGFGLANVSPDPDYPDPLDPTKTLSQLRDEREGRWVRKGAGIGAWVAIAAALAEAIAG